jgi:hypothetical protein
VIVISPGPSPDVAESRGHRRGNRSFQPPPGGRENVPLSSPFRDTLGGHTPDLITDMNHDDAFKFDVKC